MRSVLVNLRSVLVILGVIIDSFGSISYFILNIAGFHDKSVSFEVADYWWIDGY